MGYPDAAWERAMKVQDVILRALSGEIHSGGGDRGHLPADAAAAAPPL